MADEPFYAPNRIGRHDALSMLRTWRNDDVLIRCELRFRTVTAVLWSRVVAVSDTEVRFLDGERGELVLTLRADFSFSQADRRSIPDLAKKYRRGFVVAFPFQDDLGEADAIAFTELAG
jgi:hypothetical protein